MVLFHGKIQRTMRKPPYQGVFYMMLFQVLEVLGGSRFSRVNVLMSIPSRPSFSFSGCDIQDNYQDFHPYPHGLKGTKHGDASFEGAMHLV
jgi:hypothetical protein